jgi:hypothetical protein
MDIGAVLLILAVILLISIFISRPFFETKPANALAYNQVEDEKDHKRSSLLAEYDQTLSAIQELEFDHTLGKIPADEFPAQRTQLLQSAADLLRQLDSFQEKVPQSDVEDRIEAAISARRVAAAAVATSTAVGSQTTSTAAAAGGPPPPAAGDDEALETLIAMRRGARQTKAGGFCPRCGRPVQKTDRFCPKCGAPC